jgi:hypothetical protein
MKKISLLLTLLLAFGISTQARATCLEEFDEMNTNPESTLGSFAHLVSSEMAMTIMPQLMALPHSEDEWTVHFAKKRIANLVTLLKENDACTGPHITALYKKYKSGSTLFQMLRVSKPGRLTQPQFCDTIYDADRDLSLCSEKVPTDSDLINAVELHSQE